MYNLWIMLPCGCARNVWTQEYLIGVKCEARFMLSW